MTDIIHYLLLLRTFYEILTQQKNLKNQQRAKVDAFCC